MNELVRTAVALVAANIYLISLILPSATSRITRTEYIGLHAFAYGWEILRSLNTASFEWWILSICWLSNALIWLAILSTFMRYRWVCFCSSLAAMIWSLVLLANYGMQFSSPAYWTWLSSALLLFLGSLFRWPDRKHPFAAC